MMKTMMATLVAMMVWFSTTGIVLAQEVVEKEEVVEATIEATKVANQIPLPPAAAPWWVSMLSDTLGNFPDFNAGLIAVLVFLSLMLRGSAELLGFIAQKTASDKDDKILAYVSKASLWAGAVLGWFGGGKPKQVDKTKEGKTT